VKRTSSSSTAGEFIMLGGVIIILLVMILPLPSFLLDIFLTFSIAFSLAVLMVAMYTSKPLEFSVFPPLLLLVTLGRLALNVASTRLILLEGFAGDVIQTFGKFVVGGNFFVGIVVFLILVLIQFVVITNGAGRVAEVAARFTLDAMPGKQMSIDADLSAGSINQDEAQARRKEIEREADFYGSMDGAAKFVKGDAIASLVITGINLLGGFAVGVFQNGMPLMEAIQKYSILTIGDGLAGQISALLVSTATGLIVTRAASESHLGANVAAEFLLQPVTLNRLGWVLCGFALIPGLPRMPFLVMGVSSIALSKRLEKVATEATQSGEEEASEQPSSDEPEDVTTLLELEPVELAIGYALVPLVDKASDGELLERVVGVRRSLARELGIVVPPIRIRDNLALRPGEYEVKFYGEAVASGEIYPGRFLAMTSGDDLDIPGILGKDPAFGLPALWVEEQYREQAEIEGVIVVDAASVIATHLSETLKSKASDLLGRDDVQTLLDRLKSSHPKLVSAAIPDGAALTKLRRVLINLLQESVSIRDLRKVVETMADYVDQDIDVGILTEKVREGLGRTLVADYVGPEKNLGVAALSPAAEDLVARALPGGDGLGPEQIRGLITAISEAANVASMKGFQPAVIASQRIRPLVRRIVERSLPHLRVFSYEELPNDVILETVHVVRPALPAHAG